MSDLDLSAIADACEGGTPLEAPEQIIALLANPETKGMADFILQTAAEQEHDGRTVDALRSALTDPVEAVRRAAAAVLAGTLARREDGVAVAALIGHADPMVRLGTLNALANNALPREGTGEVVAALATALSDVDLAIRKEAIWALYLLGSEGVAIDPAMPVLEHLLDDPETAGNAAIALSLAFHVANDATRAAALAATPNGVVQLGAAWGAADAALRRGDLAALEAMFASEDANLRRGLGGFLHHAKALKRDLSLAGQAFQSLMKAHPDDALLHARLLGVQEIIERGPGA
jgi:HEAT repeat protein